ncbi:MAG: hypothetical protein ACK446_03730, partial [Rhodobacterales bacterium]
TRADARADAARANARTSWGRFRAWLGGLFRRVGIRAATRAGPARVAALMPTAGTDRPARP